MAATDVTTNPEPINDEHKRDTRGRRMTESRRRDEIVAGYQASGLTQKAYARHEGVNYHTLVSWLGRSRRPCTGSDSPSEPTTSTARFAQLSWPTTGLTTPRLEVILLDGLTLRGDDPAALLVLFNAIASRCWC